MSNNFIRTAADFWNTWDDDYGNYTPTHNGGDIRSLTIFPSSPLLPHPTPFGNRWRASDPWQIADRRLITESPGLVSFALQRPLALNNLARDTFVGYQWPLSIQASPNITYEQESRMTQEEQKNVLKKLRKEIYNPAPKNMFKRLSLYYRDHSNNNNIVNERVKDDDEDGKRCAVCLEDFYPREMVMVTPCNHMFHEDCIVPWVKSHAKCPVCRHQLRDPVRGNINSFTNNNNGINAEANDQSIGELLTIIRSMEEAVVRNRAR